MKIYYMDEKENKLFDFNTLQKFMKINKSKLYRMLNDLPEIEIVKYKNQFLYSEKALYILMRERLIEKLNKDEYFKD
jgi:hypothetical protein